MQAGSQRSDSAFLMLISFLACFSVLGMEVIFSSETWDGFLSTVRRCITVDGTRHSHRCENLKSYNWNISIKYYKAVQYQIWWKWFIRFCSRKSDMGSFIGTSNILNRSGPAAFTKIYIFCTWATGRRTVVRSTMTHAVRFGPRRQVSWHRSHERLASFISVTPDGDRESTLKNSPLIHNSQLTINFSSPIPYLLSSWIINNLNGTKIAVLCFLGFPSKLVYNLWFSCIKMPHLNTLWSPDLWRHIVW
jgi:hypothetical protein